MAKVIDQNLPEEGLTKFAENCVMAPSLLARRLNVDELDLEQIRHAHSHDRYEQIYQILRKWKSRNPEATWRELSRATDSGIRRTISEMYENADSSGVNSEGEDEEWGTPPAEAPTQSRAEKSETSPRKKRRVEKPSSPSDYKGESVGETTNAGRDKSVVSLLTCEKDLLSVLQVVRYESRWFELGLALGLVAPLLEDIRKSHKDDVSVCRRRMLEAWLSQQDNVQFPSWRTLCDALRSPVVGNNALANRIQRTYLP